MDSGRRKILFVCTGNLFRSPFAERITAKLILEAGEPGLEVMSAGTHAVVGEPSPAEAQAVALTFGCDLSAHRGRQLEGALLKWADLVVVMSEEHLDYVTALQPRLAPGALKMLIDFCPVPKGLDRIPDPHGGEAWVYQSVFTLIEACVRRLLQDLGVVPPTAR